MTAAAVGSKYCGLSSLPPDADSKMRSHSPIVWLPELLLAYLAIEMQQK